VCRAQFLPLRKLLCQLYGQWFVCERHEQDDAARFHNPHCRTWLPSVLRLNSGQKR